MAYVNPRWMPYVRNKWAYGRTYVSTYAGRTPGDATWPRLGTAANPVRRTIDCIEEGTDGRRRAEGNENNVGNRLDTESGRRQHAPLAVRSGARQGSLRFIHSEEGGVTMAKSPEATFRLGNVSASVFVQETGGNNGSPKREFRTVNVQRSYRDEDERKYANNFTLADLPAAIRTLQLAQAHVEERAAKVASPHVSEPVAF